MADPAAYRAAWREMCTPRISTPPGERLPRRCSAGQQSANHLVSNAAADQAVYERIFPLTAAVTATVGIDRHGADLVALSSPIRAMARPR